MESTNDAEKMPVNSQEGQEAGVQPEAVEQSPEAKKAEQLKQVERALRDLAPHMEKFQNADQVELEKNAHEQIASLEAELGEKLGAESVDLIHKNLVTEVLVRKESLQSTTDGLQREKSALEGAAEKKTDGKQKFNWRINQFSSNFLNGDIPSYFREFVQSNPSNEAFEAAAKQLGEVNKEFMADKRIGEEKVKVFTERLKTVAAELNASVRTLAEAPVVAVPVTEKLNVDLSPEESARRAEERSAQAEAAVAAAMAGMVPPVKETFTAKKLEFADDDSDAESANNQDHYSDDADTGPDSATPAEEAETKEEISKSKVEETIFNLVKAPETVLGETSTDQNQSSPEQAVKILLESLGQMYPNQDELVKRLQGIFGGYKLAWTLDRRKRPGLNEASHKKMALEDATKDLPMNEAQLIDHRLNAAGGEKEQHGLTKEKIIKNFIELIEEKSHLASSEVDAEDDGAEAEAA